jgi:Holliday junction resolvase RusA-like endonuclease
MGGYAKVYDPKAKEKTNIRTLLEVCKSDDFPEFPRISFLFHFPIPSGVSKRERVIYETGRIKHDKKPDVDNLVKLYLDCLDGIVIEGDQRVSLGPCVKVYHPEPKTIIWIHETDQKLDPWELDVAFLQPSEQCTIPCFAQSDYLFGSCDLWTQVRGLFVRTNNPDDKDQPLGSLGSALPYLE